MGILQTVWQIAVGERESANQQTRSLENPSLSLADPEAWAEVFGSSASTSGEVITPKKALGLDPFWRGVNLISNTVGKLPLFIYQRLPRGKQRDPKHPAYKILRYRPCPEMSDFTWKQTLQSHALIYGNGYSYIFRRGDGYPLETVPMSPVDTYPIRENGVLKFVTSIDNRLAKLDAANVIHIKGLGFDGLVGYSVYSLLKDPLGQASATRKYATILFKNQGRPATVLEVPVALNPQQKANIREQWERMFQGLENVHRTAILDAGMKANVLSADPENQQLIESQKFDLVRIANVLGLPPHKLGGDGRTSYASLEQENQAFLDDSIDPWLVNWEGELREKMLSTQELESDSYLVEFLRSALVRADMTARYTAYNTALNGGWMSRNEVREKENMNPFEGGDEFLQPLNMAGTDKGNNNQNKQNDSPSNPPARDLSPYQSLISQSVKRIVKRINHRGTRVARQPGAFIGWVDGLVADQIFSAKEELRETELICRQLVGNSEETNLGSWLVEQLAERWNRLASRVSPSKLEKESKLLALELEQLLPTLAVQLIFGENNGTPISQAG